MLPILKITEKACAELAASASISASLNCSIYTGLDNEEKLAPACICYAESATEDFPESGIWHIRTQIIVKEIASDSLVESTLSNTIFEKFSTVTNSILQDTVNNFGVYNIQLMECDNSTEQDAFVQTLSLEIVGCVT